MSNAMKWIGKNLSLGGLIRNAGGGIGIVTKLSTQGLGSAACLLTSDEQMKQKIKHVSDTTGKSLDAAFSKSAEMVGDLVNYGVQKAGDGVGCASGGIAKLAGASEENVALSQRVGTVIGAAAVGVIAGVGIADAAIAMGAAAGTAGGAATTSGLAALGGGSIATGGGGMAAGQAVANGIVAASSASCAASLKSNEKKEG